MPETTISHSNDEDEIVTEDNTYFSMNREECKALLKECAHSWISYENPIARQIISRMWDFVYD